MLRVKFAASNIAAFFHAIHGSVMVWGIGPSRARRIKPMQRRV
jgi:hypothetical protein